MLARNRVRFAQRVVPVHAILERCDQLFSCIHGSSVRRAICARQPALREPGPRWRGN